MSRTTRRPARALAAACGTSLLCAAATAEGTTTPGTAPEPGRALATLADHLRPGDVGRAIPAPGVLERRAREARERATRRRAAAKPGRALLTASGRAVAPPGAPWQVRRIIRAANRIATTPYVWGGGHGSFEAAGYDCSGSVSYALHGAGLLDAPLASGGLASFGRAGAGRWVTVYAHGGHTYLTVAGLRFDTSARKRGTSRWTAERGDASGYAVRHPAGL